MEKTVTSGRWQVAAVAALAAGMLGALAPQANASPQQMQITFGGYSNSPALSTLTNFPVLVVLSNDVGNSGFNYDNFVSGSGYDLRFVTNLADTTSLNYEIESWSNTASYVWVQVPLLPGDGTGAIWAKWGDATDAGQLPCTTNGSVWSDGYAAVWHLRNGTTLSGADSSANGNSGTVNGATATAGRVDGGGNFVKAGSQRVTAPYSTTLAIVNNLTLEAWINATTFSALGSYDNSVIGCDYDPSKGYDLRCGLSGGIGTLGFVFGDGTAWPYVVESTGSMLVGQWYHVVGTYDKQNLKIYVNGQFRNSAASTASMSGAAVNGVSIGAGYYVAGNWGRFFDGKIDEARISSVARSPDWILACYLSQASNTVFNSFGAMESGDTNSPSIRNQAVASVTTTSATFNGTLTSTGSSACAVCVLWGDENGGATWNWASTNWFNNGEVNASWTNGTPFSTNITSGIAENKTYWYTYGATNSTTNSVASSSKFFITGEVTVDATDPNAQFAVPMSDDGEYTFYRPLGCTNEALPVNYTMTGTATQGVHYTLSGSATFAAGETNAVLTLEPELGVGGTAILTLTPGAYPIGAADSDTVTIVPFLGKVWTGATSADWGTPGNWAGGVPGATDDVIIDGAGSFQPTINLSGGAVTIKSLTIGQNNVSTLTFSSGDVTTRKLVVTGDVTIGANGKLTHASGAARALNLDISGNLTIASGGSINVDGKGYPAGQGAFGNLGKGGGHGGEGGSGTRWPGSVYPTYGSVTNPVTPGSGGAGTAGGGVVLVRAAGNVTIDGVITAGGVIGANCGAGGSVNVRAAELLGSGSILATGGNATGNDASGGGGGRIAVVLTNSATFENVSMSAVGGTSADGRPGDSRHGGTGTIYLKGTNDTYGTLIVSNNQTASYCVTTLIGPSVTDAVVGDVRLLGTAKLTVSSSETLTVYGSWSNTSSVAGIAGDGVVEFTGPDTATFYGSTTFPNLTCTNAGKTLRFQAGTTQRVTSVTAPSSGLTLGGADGDLLNLRSTDPGAPPASWWYFRVTGNQNGMSWLSVSNSNAYGDGTWPRITAFDSEDMGGNTNWLFSAGAVDIVWDGTEDNDWGNADNWHAGAEKRVPGLNDPSITIPAGMPRYPALDTAHEYNGNLIIEDGASLTLGYDLTINGAVTNDGTLIATGAETLTIKSAVDFTGGAFTPASSTLKLAAAAGTQTFKPGGATFYRIEAANAITLDIQDDGFTATQFSCRAPGATLAFDAGITYAVTELDLRGDATNDIVLTSSGTWNLDVGRYAFVRYVAVDGSDASGGSKIYAVDSENNGGNSNWDFGNGTFWLGGTTAWGTGANWSSGSAPGPTSHVFIDETGSNSTVAGSTTITGLTVIGFADSVILTVNMAYAGGQSLTVSGDVYVGNGATLTHAGPNNPTTYRLDMDVLGNLTVAAGGSISTAGKGYSAGSGVLGAPGAGGGHGGEGGSGTRWPEKVYPTYGSVTNPVTSGSGGSGTAGGGVVVVHAAGNVTVNGVITVGGVNGGASGAGGSVNICAAELLGSGSILATGGNATGGDASGGGGGRIAVVLTDSATFGSVSLSAVGGTSADGRPGDSRHGGTGTIYLKGTNDTYGTLIVSNNQTASYCVTTLIGPNVTDAVVGDVQLLGTAKLAVSTNCVLSVYGSWSNAVAASVLSGNGTVEFAGADAATVWGNNNWYNLAIATAGKTVNFEAGKTQTINGTPTFDNGVTIQSTAASAWMLTKPGSSTQDVGVVNVEWSDASGGMTFRAAVGCVDLGDNDNWIFLQPAGTVLTLW